MMTIGHRGLKDEFPENTVSAIREASRVVDVVEVDVRPCGSNELVASHGDVVRLDGSEVRISETDLSALRSCPRPKSDGTIPAFDELLASWPPDVGMNVDVKGSTDVDRLLSRITTAKVGDPLIVSVDSRILDTFDPKLTDASIGLSFWQNPAENVRKAQESGCKYVHVYHQLCLDTDVVELAHDADLLVDAWSIDDRETTERLRKKGVDAVTVDNRQAIL